MLPPEDFERLVRLALGQYGIELDEAEMGVIRAFEQVYGPDRDALLAADLSDVEPEIPLDPSRPPLTAETGLEANRA
jgi:hypothetical protein